MNVNGKIYVKDSTQKHLRWKFEAEIGDTPHIISYTHGKLLVFPDNLERDELFFLIDGAPGRMQSFISGLGLMEIKKE